MKTPHKSQDELSHAAVNGFLSLFMIVSALCFAYLILIFLLTA